MGDSLSNATITMQEKQTAGNFKPDICSTPCSSAGTLIDNQEVTRPGDWATVQQSFTITWHDQTQPVNAMVISSDGTVLASGSTIQATDNQNGITFSDVH